MITLKSLEEIARMRRAGRVVAEMHRERVRVAQPGVTTLSPTPSPKLIPPIFRGVPEGVA